MHQQEAAGVATWASMPHLCARLLVLLWRHGHLRLYPLQRGRSRRLHAQRARRGRACEEAGRDAHAPCARSRQQILRLMAIKLAVKLRPVNASLCVPSGSYTFWRCTRTLSTHIHAQRQLWRLGAPPPGTIRTF